MTNDKLAVTVDLNKAGVGLEAQLVGKKQGV